MTTLTVFDMLGRVVSSGRQFLSAGQNRQVSLPTAQLPAGIYAVRLTSGTASLSSTLTVTR